MLRIIFVIVLFSISYTVQASCNRFQRFVMETASQVVETGYDLTSGDGCPDENGLYTLGDLFHQNLILRDDYTQIVQSTFERLENDDSWDMDGVLLRSIKSVAPSIYESMKGYFISNTSSLLNLNSSEKALVSENPVGALWVMYNGKKAKDLEERYSNSLMGEEQDPEAFESGGAREQSGYLGTGDAFRHIAWNTLSSRFGFDDFAKRFIDAHEIKDEPAENPPANGVGLPPADGPMSTDNQTLSMMLMSAAMSGESEHDEHNRRLDTQMDVHNNNLGRDLAQEMYCTVSEDKIFNRIRQSIDNGEALIVDNCMGQKWKIVRSNQTFEECNTMIDGGNILQRCEELRERITHTARIDALMSMVEAGESEQAISCAYYRSVGDHAKENLRDDERASELFARLETTTPTPEQESEQSEKESNIPSLVEISEEEQEYLCSKIISLNISMVANDAQCSEALMQIGFMSNMPMMTPGMEGDGGAAALEELPSTPGARRVLPDELEPEDQAKESSDEAYF